jgi:hypothetical protein
MGQVTALDPERRRDNGGHHDERQPEVAGDKQLRSGLAGVNTWARGNP